MSWNTDKEPLRLADRLRGKYVLPVNDGAGPLNGSMTFTRQFQTTPIMHEAAAEIERLELAVASIPSVVVDALKNGAPGLSDITRDAIGRAVGLRVTGQLRKDRSAASDLSPEQE